MRPIALPGDDKAILSAPVGFVSDLPTQTQLDTFSHSIRYHTMIHESLRDFFRGFHYDAHPMAMLTGVVGSLSAFYGVSRDPRDKNDQEIFAHRMIAKIPTIAACAYKHSIGQPFVYPRNDLDYCSNLLDLDRKSTRLN